MARIRREQENTVDIINWFIRDGATGNLEDQYLVEFQIFRIEDGLPGTQVFPVTGWEDVTNAPGKFATGSYYAYDNGNSQGWTPDAGASLGTHRIFWRWKQFASSIYQEGADDFELMAQDAAGPAITYIDVADVRAEGVDPSLTDEQIQEAIETWQMVLERACRQWFYERALTINFDGNNSDTVHFGVPIITVEHVKINESSDVLDTSLYKVYNSRTYPDNRRNPRIRLVHSQQITDIHVAPFTRGELKFYKGFQNQEVKGTFGFTEADGSVPLPIQRALLKLVIEKLTRPIIPGDDPPEPSSLSFAGVTIEERTDGHMVKYGGGTEFEKRRVGLSGITTDPEILDIIRLYKAPMGIALPSHWSYF